MKFYTLLSLSMCLIFLFCGMATCQEPNPTKPSGAATIDNDEPALSNICFLISGALTLTGTITFYTGCTKVEHYIVPAEETQIRDLREFPASSDFE